MNIEIYIGQLLYRYQCVTVPGFGAFLTETQSAQLIENTHSFLPPKKVIAFNSFLKNNDGLLANHIAQVEKTSYEYAVSAIEYAVLNWKKTLQENGIYSLKNIGTLSLNADRNIIFNPNNQTNYLTNSFGLSTFVSPAIKREIFKQLDAEIVEEVDVLSISETKSSTSYLKYVAVFIFGLGLTTSIAYPLYQNRIETETILVQTAVQKKVQNRIQEATFFIQSPIPAVTLSIKEGKLPYHIMAGAFRNEKNAQKIYEKLSSLGYKARRIDQKNGLYPVLYGSFRTIAEAEKAKTEIQKKHNPDAWILIESL